MATATLLNTFEAATIWRDRALLGDRGLFSEADVWSMTNLRALWVALTREKFDLHRLESLGEQLRDTEPAVVRLAAELFWLMYLTAGPACISQSRKSDIVRTIYDWSGESLPSNHPLLDDVSLSVSNGPGLFFSVRRSDELLFLIKAVVGVKKHSNAERRELLSDPWATGRMLDDAAGNEAPQLNHIIRHLLFPEHYEPVFTRRDKRRIVESFSGIPRREIRRWPATQLDEELNSIKKQLQPLYGDQALSFFDEPLVASWRHGRGETIACEQRFWVEKCDLESRADRLSGRNRLGQALWSPRQSKYHDDTPTLMREVEPGDVIFHFTDNQGITGASIVESEMDEEFVCPDESPWRGQPGYRLQLMEHTEVTPMLSRTALLTDAMFQDDLKRLASDHGTLFFNKQLTMNRGHYLSEAPEGLVRIFNEVYRHESKRNLPHIGMPDQQDLPAVTQARSQNLMPYPLTQLLRGVTGTGKTWNAMVRAVKICDGSASGNHDQLMNRYRELQEAGQIEMVTFHPTFGYAEFIEGARTTDSHTATDREGTKVECVPAIRPGILKSLATRAAEDSAPESSDTDLTSSALWKVTPPDNQGETAFQDLIDGRFVACGQIGEIDFSNCTSRSAIRRALSGAELPAAAGAQAKPGDDTISTLDQLVNQMNLDDLVMLIDHAGAIRAIGRISGGYETTVVIEDRRYHQTRPVQWVATPDEPQPWHRIARKEFLPRPLYRLDASLLRVDALQSMLTERCQRSSNYVLIIDEIGRTDLARTFGEMLTLVDPDKRRDGINPTSVLLPLSGEPFSLPDNLYLIGTLNSADPMDPVQAEILLRRFEFEELTPDASLIPGDDQLGMIADGEGGRIDLRSLMITINRRIEFLASQERQIGHGLFMHIRCYEDLLHTIRARVLPHLLAVFDNDWRKAQLVFRDVLKDGSPNTPQLISHEQTDSTSALGFEQEGMNDQIQYWITADRDLRPDTFRKIYSDF